MRRRTVQSPLPYTNPSSCDFADTNGKNKNSNDNSTKFTLLVTIFVLVPGGVFGLNRLKRRRNAQIGLFENGNIPSSATAYFGEDTDERCTEWAASGQCITNRRLVLSKCPHSCHRIAGVSVESLSENDVTEDAILGYAHFIHEGDEDGGDDGGNKECRDYDEKCEALAEEGKCMEDADTMSETCPRACLLCFGRKPTTVTIDFGVEQQVDHADPNINAETVNVIRRTQKYMVDEVFKEEEFEDVRRDCRNLDPHCAQYAAMGECHGEIDAMGMQQNCAPACHACNGLEYWRRCMRSPEQVDAMQPGDMHAMFERIIHDYPQYKPAVLSRPAPADKDMPEDDSEGASDDEGSDEENPLPWIVTLEGFLTDEECDWFIAKGYEAGWEQTSEISDEIEEDGTYGDKIGEWRTSTDFWCQDDCEDQPVARGVMDRMVSMTKIPEANTEPLEILKYEEGGHYESHHDIIHGHTNQRCGARIVTIYTFLSEVEEGGELRFTELDNLEIKPRKGMAVIWNNVLNDDLSEWDEWTFHEAMPVKRGKKFGANQWFHLRDHRAAQELECCE